MAKKLCLYGILTAVCMVIGYLETLISFGFIAPGIKPGFSNAIALVLIVCGDKKGALTVNITRILLSSLLFGNLMSLCFALAGGLCSWAAMCLFAGGKRFGVVGLSIVGGTVHNSAQLAVAFFIIGRGVVWYLPALLAAGAVCGFLCGILADLMIRKLPENFYV